MKQIIDSLQKEEQVLLDATLSAREAATESEAKPENEYDTRGLEQSYLAAGQAKRALEIKACIQSFRDLPLSAFDKSTPIDLSAIIELEDEEGTKKIYFLVPERGGIKINFEDQDISTVSTQSPLGKSLIGKRLGGDIEINLQNEIRSLRISNLF